MLRPLVAIAACAAVLTSCSDGAPASTVPNRAFPSAVDPQAPATVWAVGDGADGGTAARAVAAHITADHPDRLLYLGDVYETGSASEFADHFNAVYRALKSITAPTPGNHEWPARTAGYDPYWRGVTGAATPPWYAFRIGGWRVLSLNSEAAHDAGSPQLRWLRAQLEQETGTCTMAIWHRPRYSTGLHGDQPDVQPFWDALRGHAALVLNGHDHDMQRFRARRGTTEVVAGAGGHGLYPLRKIGSQAFVDDHHYGALRLELEPGRAQLAFVLPSGRVLDQSTVGCR